MLLRSIKNLEFGSITLEVSQSDIDPNSVKRLGIINASFAQAVSDLSEMDSELEGLRIRIIASYDKKSSQSMDFVTQRFNEYLVLEKRDTSFRQRVPSNRYISFLKESLGELRANSVLSQTQPFSPYSTDRGIIPQMFARQFSSDNVLNDTIYYDIPLTEVLPRDDNGQIIRRPSSAVSTNVGIPPNRTEIQMNEQGLWTEQSIEQELLDPTQNVQRLHLTPVVFDLSDVSVDNLQQLTFYMFAYKADFAEPGDNFNLPEFSLITGMSMTRTANVIGERTFWPRISLSHPYRGPGVENEDGFQDTVVVAASDSTRFQRIEIQPQERAIERIDSMFDRVYARIARTILDDKPEVKKIIKNKNTFSNLWITKDSDENNRFMFAFDLQSCLLENSYYPFLYRSPNIANQLINKDGFMRSSDPSRVLMMNVKRGQTERDADIPDNDLGTSGGRKKLGPSKTFPEKIIGEATPVENMYLEMPGPAAVPNKIIFYEGKDRLSKTAKYEPEYEIINNELIYGVEYVVYDAAPIFMRNLIKHLIDRKALISEIFSIVVNSVPTPQGYQGGMVLDFRDLYNPVNQTLNVPLSKIQGKIGGVRRSLLDALLAYAEEYQRILDDLVPFQFESNQIDIAAFYRSEFQKNDGLIDPLSIKDLEKLIDVGIQLIYRRLTEFFPNDPMGVGLDIRVESNLQRRGFCQRKTPIIKDQYHFDTKISAGKTFGFGSDYIFRKEIDRGELDGLARISLVDYIKRVEREFVKYFQRIVENDNRMEPVESFIGPAYCYFTSKVIRTPGRRDVNQLDVTAARPIVRYDLNKYAQLFSDIVNLKFDIKNRQTNPQVIDSYTRQPENNILYDSVIKALEEQHCVEITTDLKPQYNPPKMVRGETPPAVGEDVWRSYVSIFQNGPLAIPTIIGGENNTDSSVISYLGDVADSLARGSSQRSKSEVDKQLDRKSQRRLPIKLPFAILGELSVDPELDYQPLISYKEKQFNALKEFASFTGTTGVGINDVIEGRWSALPNQVKSAIVISATDQQSSFGNIRLRFDACRPMLKDIDSGDEDMMVSFSFAGANEPPYSLTYDPMKVYAKFLTFWMNYKNIVRVEYLNNFDSLLSPEGFYSDTRQLGLSDAATAHKTKLPNWLLLTQERLAEAVKDQKNLLCRVRFMSPKDYVDILAAEKEPVKQMARMFFERIDMLELPIYNQYFLLGKNNEIDTGRQSPPKYTDEMLEEMAEEQARRDEQEEEPILNPEDADEGSLSDIGLSGLVNYGGG